MKSDNLKSAHRKSASPDAIAAEVASRELEAMDQMRKSIQQEPKPAQQMYKIGEFAKLTGLSIPTLRYYDQLGVLSPEVKLQNGYRLYAGRQLFETQFISNMKSVGLSLEDIRYLVQHPEPDVILPKLENLQRKLAADLCQIQNLEKYFRIGASQPEQLSLQNIEHSQLAATYAICTEIEESHAEGIFGYHAQALQKKRDELGLRQHSGMRIVLRELTGGIDEDGSGSDAGDAGDAGKKPVRFNRKKERTASREPAKNLLICPVHAPETEAQKAAVQWFPKKKTVSCILRKEDVDYAEEIRMLREHLSAKGLEAADSPAVAEGLLDPGDLPGQTMILVRLHLPVR